MKHLKRFNEGVINESSISSGDLASIQRNINNLKITPATEKVSIDSIYDFIYIEFENEVEISRITYKYLMIDTWQGVSSLYFYKSLDKAVNDIHPDYLSEFNREDGFEDWIDFVNHFKQQDRFKDILSYNDINFQEIENVLIDYGINIQNMWGIVK